MKVCNRCKENLPDDRFSKRTYRSGNIGLQNKCKDCERKSRPQYYKPHDNARRKFGLSEEDYTTLINRSQGLCETCNKPMGDKRCIDHDHSTGKVRGVLCNKCNTALGLLSDDIQLLGRLIQYLEQSEQQE